MHSPAQLELARKLLDKYTTSFAAALAVTESLSLEEQRLLATYQENYKLIELTEEATLLNVRWTDLKAKAADVESLTEKFSADRKSELADATESVRQLELVKVPLKNTLAALDNGLASAESAPTLNDKLSFVRESINSSIELIGNVDKALTDAAAAAATKPGMIPLQQTVKRLQPLAPKVRDYFDKINSGPARAPNQQVSLAVEATRLARDILAVEVEIVDLEIDYHEELKALSGETLRFTMEKGRFNLVTSAVAQHTGTPAEGGKKVSETLKEMAEKGDSQEQDMQDILQGLGTYYSALIETSRAKDMLELRRQVLTYRHAKLLDVAYDRQRRTLISYGLLAAVRYAEGGWKTEDTAQLMRLIQIGLQAGILTKL
jgi:hypothetical protein